MGGEAGGGRRLCAPSLGSSRVPSVRTSHIISRSTSVVGVFISQSDVGLGTIIGSAVFNVLFVIACCAFVAPNLHLHWYPLARDASYYCFSIFVLITFIYDKRVDWWEALVLLLLYALCAARRIQPTTVADQNPLPRRPSPLTTPLPPLAPGT